MTGRGTGVGLRGDGETGRRPCCAAVLPNGPRPDVQLFSSPRMPAVMDMSRSELIDQLEIRGLYTSEQAAYGAAAAGK